MSEDVTVIAPPGEPERTLEELLSGPNVSALVEVPRGQAAEAAADAEFWLHAGAYVIASIADPLDATEFRAAVTKAMRPQ